MWHSNDNRRDPRGDGTVLNCDCINVNVLAVIVYYSSANATIGENWLKGTLDLSVSFLTTAYDPTIISK